MQYPAQIQSAPINIAGSKFSSESFLIYLIHYLGTSTNAPTFCEFLLEKLKFNKREALIRAWGSENIFEKKGTHIRDLRVSNIRQQIFDSFLMAIQCLTSKSMLPPVGTGYPPVETGYPHHFILFFFTFRGWPSAKAFPRGPPLALQFNKQTQIK